MYRFANGDTYEGDWYEHKKHGYGIYTYAVTGTSYRGMWEQGKKKGPGEIVHANHKFNGEHPMHFVHSCYLTWIANQITTCKANLGGDHSSGCPM